MYSDRIRKRSVQDRLGADAQNGDEQHRSKRFQVSDRKWRHDSNDDVNKSRQSGKNEQISTQDLRHKLKKGVGKGTQSKNDGAGGVKDLREKLSGTTQHFQIRGPDAGSMPQQWISPAVRGKSSTIKAATMSKLPPAAKPPAPAVKPAAPAFKSVWVPIVKPVAPDVNKPSSTSKISTGMQGMTIATFLQSLDLSKYLITFQAEEIDMPILRMMKEAELKELGIPMGPRKKIALALAAQKS